MSNHEQLKKKKKKGPWKFEKWLHQIINISLELKCSFCWSPNLGNHATYALANHEIRHLVSFARDFLPQSIIMSVVLTILTCVDKFSILD